MIQTAGSLIQTKLHPPFIRPGVVSRPRLQERVLQGLRGPLTLIIAPAGFGKTTLAASCLTASGMPVAWLSLDKNDNQEGRFLQYLIAALQEADVRIGQGAAQLVAGIQPASPEAVLTSLVNDLDTTGVEIVLALDDYQFITSRAVHEGITFLLAHCPHTFHLVIVTRSDPPLPLARLRARGQTGELRAADLRFTGPEAAQFLNDVMGLRLEAGSIAALEARTEGWITGLQMAALSMRDREDVPGFIAGFSGTNRFILDYLLEEVLGSQPPEIQHFLFYTSILERLTAPLCDALLRDDNGNARDGSGEPAFSPARSAGGTISSASAILEYLERENLFLVPLDEERTWFRYHHLFVDLLRARMEQAQAHLLPLLHRRASKWLEGGGFIPEAIQHLFAAGEMDRAADLIERYGPVRLVESDPAVLQMAESLPPDILLARPKIGLYRAWLAIIQGRIGTALPLLKDLAQHLDSASPHSEGRWMQTIAVSALAFLMPPPGALEEDPLPEVQLLEEIPAEERILRNAADFLYTMALARRGQYGRAIEVAVRCIHREKPLPGSLAIPTLVPFLTRIYLMLGRLRVAASTCREYLDPIADKGVRFVFSTGSMEIDLGEVLYEWNRLDEAGRHIRAGLRVNEPWKNIMTDGFGLIALARVLQAQGDHTGAMQVIEQLEIRLQDRSRPREFEEDFRTLRVRAQLAGGDLLNPAHWADQIEFSQDFALHPERYWLTLARIRLAQGRYAEVESLLAGAAPPNAAGSHLTRQLEADLLLAVALAGQQRLPEAFERIETALDRAEPEGYIRVFLDLGDPVRELLAAYLRSQAPRQTPFAQKVLAAFSASGRAGSAGPQPAGLVEPLTERELEVLQLLARGMANKEIARQLVVAAGTVKAHAASIYRKLEAANRTEAVARARGLGLLP